MSPLPPQIKKNVPVPDVVAGTQNQVCAYALPTASNRLEKGRKVDNRVQANGFPSRVGVEEPTKVKGLEFFVRGGSMALAFPPLWGLWGLWGAEQSKASLFLGRDRNIRPVAVAERTPCQMDEATKRDFP